MANIPRSIPCSALALAITLAVTPAAIAYQASGAPPGDAAPADVAQQHDRFIISYRDAGSLSPAQAGEQLDNAAEALGIGIRMVRTLGTGARLIQIDRSLSPEAQTRLVEALMANPEVLAVDPDRIYRPLMVPNDPRYAEQWSFKDGAGGIDAEAAWDLSTGEGVVVAVLDSGSTPHAELIGRYVSGYDFISHLSFSVDGDGRDADPNDPGDWSSGDCFPPTDPMDSSWHGTKVAGTIAAATNNGVGVAGVAHDAEVQPVRVIGRCQETTRSDLIDAITWASGGSVAGVPVNATPAEVINISIGSRGFCSTAEQQAIDAAVARGSIIVTAAGNDGRHIWGTPPGNCRNVVTVASTGADGGVSAHTNWGARVEVAGPGDGILTTTNDGVQGQGNDAYGGYTGTSASTAHVSGTVALMQAAAVEATGTPKTPAEITEILVNTAYASNGFPEGCPEVQQCGSGLIDARHAVAVAAGLEPLPDAPPPPPPGVELQNGISVTGIDIHPERLVRYYLQVPNGAEDLSFTMSGEQDRFVEAMMYVRHGTRATRIDHDCRKSLDQQTCFFAAPESGTWHVMILADPYGPVVDLTLHPSFVDNNWPRSVSGTLEQHGEAVQVALRWDAGKQSVDIYRNGGFVRTVDNRGETLDVFPASTPGPASYIVCNAGTHECSDPLVVE